MAETNQTASQVARSDELEARRALALVESDPVEAQRILLALSGDVTGSVARSVVLLGLARLAYHRGAIDDASIAFEEALDLALDTKNLELETDIRVSWSLALQAAGRHVAALEQIALAVPHLGGAGLGRALTQRGLIHATAGRRDEALRDYDAGLPLLLVDDQFAAMRTFSNRGVVLTHLAQYERAAQDFASMRSLAIQLRQHAVAAGALHNLAYLHGKAGRFIDALAGFDTAREAYQSIGSLDRHLADLDLDECEVLLELGLGIDAVPLAERVVALAGAAGNTAQRAEGLLMLARAQTMAGYPAIAVEAAAEALQLFSAAGRDAWAAQARYRTFVAAQGDSGHSPHAILRQFVRLRRDANELEVYGWLSEAAEVRVLTGRLALAAGRRDVASDVLRTASTARLHPLARVRVGAWHATAMLHAANGNPQAAGNALRAGLRAVEQHRASLGATELRSATGMLGAPLAADGLALAIRSRRPARVFEWAERTRAGALGSPGSYAESPVPAALRASLRGARHRLNEAITDGEDVVDQLRATVANLETELSRRSRQRQVSDGITSAESVDAAKLRAALGTTTLVEYVQSDGLLFAVVCSERRLRFIELSSIDATAAANEHLAFAVRRLATAPDGPIAHRAWNAFQTARAEVDQLLFAQLRGFLGDGPLVVVPTGALHDVLWGALPTSERRSGLAVAPSAAWWMRPRGAPRAADVLLVAGPALPHAVDEIRALRELYPQATVLTGSSATAEAVLAGLATASLVHIAAHGVFRSDNPMFSTLQLADGPLFVHEMEALPQVPDTVVLAACSSGRSGVLPGDELLGTSAVLMGAGVRTVIAPLIPIGDDVSRQVVTALHQGLLSGQSAAATLAEMLRSGVDDRSSRAVAALSSYTCVAASNR